MKISVSDILKIVELVLEKYEINNGENLNTEQDNFWFVDMEDGLDLSKEVDKVCVGSIEDDYTNLETILTQNREINILDLDRISNILRIISFEIQKSDDKQL